MLRNLLFLHNKKADHSSDRPAYMIEFECASHALWMRIASSGAVVLSVAFQNQRPSEDDLFCCVLERKTRLVIHNRTCSLSYSFVVSCQSFVANIAAISDISNFKHNILYPIFITKRTWHKITSQSLLLRKWGYYLWGEYIYNE